MIIEVNSTPRVITVNVADTRCTYTYPLESIESTWSTPDWGAADRLKALERAEKTKLKALRHREERAKWRR